MSLSPQVAIVIVSYNTKKLLLECLASVVESARSIPHEIVVVDNASQDGSSDAVRQAYPGIILIGNPTNKGFGAACNQAIQSTSSPFILLLNSDARLTREAFLALIGCLYGQERCGAAGCRLVSEQGREMVNTWNFLTPFNQALEQLNITPRLNSRTLRRTHQVSPSADHCDCSVDWIDGACLMLRRKALDEIGLFDEQFFMYSEDEDLCHRLHKEGWSVCFSDAATALHHGRGSSSQNEFEMLVQFYSSQMRLLLKHHGPASMHLYVFLMKTVLALKTRALRLFSKNERWKEFQRRRRALSQARSLKMKREAF